MKVLFRSILTLVPEIFELVFFDLELNTKSVKLKARKRLNKLIKWIPMCIKTSFVKVIHTFI